MPELNTITAIIAACAAALVIRGLLPYWRKGASSELRYFAIGLSWALGVFLLRTIYWGALRGLVIAVDPDHWTIWGEITRSPVIINAAFDFGLTVGCWYILRAFHEMIPDNERPNWSVISSAFYPRGWCFMRLGVAFRNAWRKK